jgi:hypothetical protein
MVTGDDEEAAVIVALECGSVVKTNVGPHTGRLEAAEKNVNAGTANRRLGIRIDRGYNSCSPGYNHAVFRVSYVIEIDACEPAAKHKP